MTCLLIIVRETRFGLFVSRPHNEGPARVRPRLSWRVTASSVLNELHVCCNTYVVFSQFLPCAHSFVEHFKGIQNVFRLYMLRCLFAASCSFIPSRIVNTNTYVPSLMCLTVFISSSTYKQWNM